MSEAQHLSEALSGFFVDPESGWFTPFAEVLKGLTAAQAAFVPQPGFNSIWAVTNHVWFWQEFLLHRLRGQEFDYHAMGEGWPPAGSADDEDGWQAACQRALQVNAELAEVVAALTQEELDSAYSPGRAERWKLVQGMIAHNSYHTCEIISLRHLQGLWLERV